MLWSVYPRGMWHRIELSQIILAHALVLLVVPWGVTHMHLPFHDIVWLPRMEPWVDSPASGDPERESTVKKNCSNPKVWPFLKMESSLKSAWLPRYQDKTNNPHDLERQKKTQEMANHVPVNERNHQMIPSKKNHTQKRKSKVKKEIHNSLSNQKGTVPMDEELRNVVMNMARERGTSKTCWPSEVPRRIAKQQGGGPWRDWMSLTHRIIKDLATSDEIKITQRGEIRNPASNIVGPYRFRISK